MKITYEKEYDNVLDELVGRGYYEASTDEAQLKKLLREESMPFYIGFDATADSLTVGHFIQIMVMMRMQAYGHSPIVLLGDGTTMIGDPSGRSDMRTVMTRERIQANAQKFYVQFQRFLDFVPAGQTARPGEALLRHNADWLLSLNFLQFMREIGVHFNVGEMIKKDAYRNRLNNGGLTFFEFGYMLLQSYDFLELYRRDHCRLQLGGSDQWANIIGGVELVRKAENADVYGMTFQLLTTADGVKMGKSQKGAVWLDETKTTPYELFQYMRNVDDRDVKKFLYQLTFLPAAQCEELGGYTDERINRSKEVLAFEVTKLVHGAEKATEAMETARALFADKANTDRMPHFTVPQAMVSDEIGLLSLMTAAGLTRSNGEARRLVQQGGISLDDEKVIDPALLLPRERLENGVVLRKGKKIYLRITL